MTRDFTKDQARSENGELAPRFDRGQGTGQRGLSRFPDWQSGGQDFDDLARIAALVCRAPMASIAIIARDKVWQQAQFGWGHRREIAMEDSFARFVVERAGLVVIPDATADPVFRHSAYVTGEPHLRFAAGVPLLVDARPIGILCVFDRVARDLSDEAALALEALARQCVSQLELRRALRSEREAGQRLSLIIDGARDYAIVSLDLDGRIESWNDGAEIVFGWTEDEAIGRHVAALYTPADRDTDAPALDLASAAAHGREIHERYYERKNRASFWGTGETMPLLAADGSARGYIKILRDRTDQKRTKEALEYQAGVLQAITDHLTEALFQVDVDHRITFVNPAAEALFGWSRAELVGVNLHDRLHAHLHDHGVFHRNDCPYVIALRNRATLRRRADVFVHRDGRLIDVVASFAPIMTDGQVTGGLVTLVDATETLKTEEALRRSEERYRLAVAASGTIGSWDWDLRARTVVADSIFAEQYGVDPGVAETGAPLESFASAIHPDDRDRVFAAIDNSIATKEPYVDAYRLLRPDGSIRWVAAHARCQYDRDGRPVRYPGLSVDITAHKRQEQRRYALLDLEDQLRNEESTSEIAGLAAKMLCRLLETKRAGFSTIDATGHYATIERDYVADGSTSMAGTYRLGKYGALADKLVGGEIIAIEDVASAPDFAGDADRWKALDVAALVYVPLQADGRIAAIFYVHSGTPRAWPPEDIALISNVSDRTWAAIARAQGNKQQRILTGELRHRIKNTMAMVLAIANQTMRKAATKEEGFEAFEARILALDEAQNILTQSSWSSATIEQIVTGAMAPHASAAQARISWQGPPVNLSAHTALSFALALHELATNAAKYGALSNEVGVVVLEWSIAEEDGDPMFALVWQERGGPPVVPPTTKGFGSRLIKGSFARAIRVAMDYRPEGLVCTFRAPLAVL